ncbi:hypothetical protein M2303_002807, partial [Micromonospora sp. H404/HB375]|nr:hypothetical protein [Micromonospora sp. H404/HB375]
MIEQETQPEAIPEPRNTPEGGPSRPAAPGARAGGAGRRRAKTHHQDPH